MKNLFLGSLALSAAVAFVGCGGNSTTTEPEPVDTTVLTQTGAFSSVSNFTGDVTAPTATTCTYSANDSGVQVAYGPLTRRFSLWVPLARPVAEQVFPLVTPPDPASSASPLGAFLKIQYPGTQYFGSVNGQVRLERVGSVDRLNFQGNFNEFPNGQPGTFNFAGTVAVPQFSFLPAPSGTEAGIIWRTDSSAATTQYSTVTSVSLTESGGRNQISFNFPNSDFLYLDTPAGQGVFEASGTTVYQFNQFSTNTGFGGTNFGKIVVKQDVDTGKTVVSLVGLRFAQSPMVGDINGVGFVSPAPAPLQKVKR